LGFISDAISQIKLKQYEAAAKTLSDHLNEEGLREASKISLMEWIAECYLKVEKKHEAAMWLERAARSALQCDELTEIEKKRLVSNQLSQAIDYYYTENDTEGLKRASTLKYSMQF
jgi:hypothetical protein